jgi:phosphate:Na+ symporter
MGTEILFKLVGGLGIFLLGMKYMSEGAQAIAGTGLRRIISTVTDNRIMAVIAGTMMTVIVQSSSVTTVMVVGFVNGGLMNLAQAIGVIMGANIGTTITGWILVLKIGKYGLPIMGASALLYLFSGHEKRRYLGMAFMGIGMVFFGLEIMKSGCSVIKEDPRFDDLFLMVQATNFVGMALCMMVGCFLTMLVQSSSATLGITISLAITGAISYPTAAALVLGENIGTTITALLASIGATTNARRAAYFHVLFNMVGVMWIATVFFLYIQFVPWALNVDVDARTLTDSKTNKVIAVLHTEEPIPDGYMVLKPDQELPVGIKECKISYNTRTMAIAATHTIFNVTNTLVLLPLAGLFSTFLLRWVPDPKVKEKPHLTSLDIRILETPVIAIEQSQYEVRRMADGCGKMMHWLKELLAQDEPDEELVKKLFHREEVLDNIQDEIVHFMTHLLSASVPHDIIDEGRGHLRISDELESVSDAIASILKFHMKLRNQGFKLDQEHMDRLMALHDKVNAYVDLIINGLDSKQADVMAKANSFGSEIKHSVKESRRKHLEDLSKERMEPGINLTYNSSLNAYRSIRDHLLNVAEVMSGEK